MEINNDIHKLSLYANDVLEYASNLLNTILVLMEEIKRYGNLLGFKINMNETEALALNCHISSHIKALFPFKWPKEGIKYLERTIPLNLDKLYQVNYSKIIKKIYK